MRILNPSDPWPQVFVRRIDSGGFLQERYEDKGLCELVVGAVDVYTHDHYHKPTTIFVGPRAARKIKDLFIEEKYIFTTIDFSGVQKKEFLGMELVFTIDDGLWIA